MMHAFVTGIITTAAQAAGLPEGRVIDQAAKDNLTLFRPRVEIQFLPERYQRTGRSLSVSRTLTELARKKELYTVDLSVAANVLAEDRAWLDTFCRDFVVNLPRGANDDRGNWVKIRAEKATFGRAADKRVGNSVIEVFLKVNQLLNISFGWRITAEEVEQLIPTFTINAYWKGDCNGEKEG